MNAWVLVHILERGNSQSGKKRWRAIISGGDKNNSNCRGKLLWGMKQALRGEEIYRGSEREAEKPEDSRSCN